MKRIAALGGLLIGALPAAAAAQEAPAPPRTAPDTAPQPQEAADDAQPDDIVVKGELRGAVVGDIQPELQLSPADIRAYGVSSVADLLTELAPQTRSGRGRGDGGPVVLLNGRRISNFSEIRDLPTEAIERVDILPEEVALKYGYRADQRVVNFVLRPRFRAITGEATGTTPTAGGTSTLRGEVSALRIGAKGRINIDAQYRRSSALLESERDIVPAGAAALFDTTGNVTAPGGSGEIDPALSALAGEPVVVAGVPGSAAAAAPTLGDFAATANSRNVTALAPYRTLITPSEQFSANAVVSRNLSQKVSASFNARLEATHSEAQLGLAGLALILPAGNPFSPFTTAVQLNRYAGPAPLTRDNQGQTLHAGFSVNGDALPWRWSVTGNFDRATSRTITTTGVDPLPLQARLDAGDPGFNPFGPIPPGSARNADLANSTSTSGSIDALLSGPVARLPAGDVATSLRLGASASGLDSSSLRAGVPLAGNVARSIASGQLNLDLPIASRRRAVLDALGDLSLNGNVEVERLSDFGTLVTTGYGAVWSPLKQLRFIASVTDEDGAPSAQQLGNPAVTTPNVRVFDYVRGETADVTAVTRGNPFLGADSRHVTKLGFNARPFENVELTLSADYVRSTTRDQIADFPTASAEVEAAFPDRFLRDSDGRLVRIDMRPVNFARADQEQLRWGINFSKPLGSTIEKRFEERRAERQAARDEAERNGTPLPPEGPRREGRDGARQGGEGRRFGGSGGGGGFGGGSRGFRGMGGPNGYLAGRIQFSLYHTIHLRDEVVIRDSLPVLDLLDGSATGSRGGQPRHEIEAQAGISKDGLGLRVIGNWESRTRVRSGALGSGDSLDFSSLATVNLRGFIDLGQQISWVREHRWLRGTRVTLSVDNLFDSRLRVTDANGVVPLSYQPDLLDPTGRTIRLSIRKLFF